MSFEESLVKIAEREQKVYNSGYSKGQKSMVDESKIIEKTAIGTTTLTIDDVSEIPHEVDVQLGGYNLFKGETIKEKYYLNAETNGLNSFKVFGINGTGTPKYVRYEFDAIPNTNMVVSCDWSSVNSNNALQRIGVFNSVTGLKFLKWSNGIYGDLDNKHFVCNFNTGDATKIAILFYCENPNYGTILPNYEASVINIQLTEGTTDLPFMPYDADFSGISLSVNGEAYTSPSNGLISGIKSYSPEMTLTTNEGLKIEARYHKSWGMQTEYDRFWDIRQNYGKRLNYSDIFAYYEEDIFNPKYDLSPTRAYRMFYAFGEESKKVIDLVELLSKRGRILDFSNMMLNRDDAFQFVFSYSYISHIGVIDLSNGARICQAFNPCSHLITIDKLILSELGDNVFKTPFNNCTKLENITIEGVIGQNGFDMQWSTKLSKASITSIINALSSTTSGLTVTLSKTAVNSAFGSTTSDEWLNLIATKPNWTISLV